MKFNIAVSSKTMKSLAASFAVAISSYASVSKIAPDQVGLRDTFYAVTGDLLKPGIYFQFPYIQYTHKYSLRTQQIEFNAGSCRFIPVCDSTGDRNPLMAQIVLQYKVTPDLQKINFHRWAMGTWGTGRDGYWLITDLLNTSANAVMGQKSMAETLSNPDGFIHDLRRDFAERLETNNIPVKIESLELKSFLTSYVPTRTVSYANVISNQASPQP